MKKISQHLGEIIIALGCIMLIVATISLFSAPIGDFYGRIVNTELAAGQKILDSFDNIEMPDNQSKQYKIIKGAGQIYTTGTLTFTSDAPFDKFDGVKINGEIVDPTHYTITEGSTIVTFTDEYAQLLTYGEYDIEVIATDGKAAAPFGVNDLAQETSPFYVYNRSTTALGWQLALNSNFKTALINNSDYIVDGETLWTAGSPLPNPGATYNGYPVVSYEYTFNGCDGVTSLDLSEWDTSNLVNTAYFLCSPMGPSSTMPSLISLDLSGWNLSKVTHMNNMFSFCTGLTSINLSGWNTSNVMIMSNMFQGCTALETIDVSNWNTSSVTSMIFMFDGCTGLTSLNVSSWNTSSCTNMGYMFQGCTALETIDVSNWNTSSVTSMMDMFNGCTGLTSLDVSGWNTSSVTRMSYMFSDCAGLTSINVSGWNTSSVTSMNYMFKGCAGLTSINVSGWDTSSCTNMSYMFRGCTALESFSANGWDTSSCENMSYMFQDCTSLETFSASNWNTSKTTNMRNMFYGCSALTSLDLSGWDTSSCTTMSYMFRSCTGLTSITVATETDKTNIEASTGFPSTCTVTVAP